MGKERNFVNREDAIKASLRTNDLGVNMKQIYKSIILALTLLVILISSLVKCLKVQKEVKSKYKPLLCTDDALRTGKFLTGQMTIYGTKEILIE